jgi:hypothetical protein
MRHNNTLLLINAILVLMCLIVGCGYVAGNYPPPDPTAVPDSNKIITVNGKRYRCLNKDGTWKCEAIAEALSAARRDINDPKYLDASHR